MSLSRTTAAGILVGATYFACSGVPKPLTDLADRTKKKIGTMLYHAARILNPGIRASQKTQQLLAQLQGFDEGIQSEQRSNQSTPNPSMHFSPITLNNSTETPPNLTNSPFPIRDPTPPPAYTELEATPLMSILAKTRRTESYNKGYNQALTDMIKTTVLVAATAFIGRRLFK